MRVSVRLSCRLAAACSTVEMEYTDEYAVIACFFVLFRPRPSIQITA